MNVSEIKHDGSKIKKNLDNILHQRREKVEVQRMQIAELESQWKKNKEKLSQIYSTFSSLELEEDRRKVCSSSEDAAYLEGLQTKMKETEQAFQEAIKELKELETRYSRPTVNLVAVGAIGAGKSKFLQSASALGDNCIPSYAGRSCTGVTSIIENKDVETQAVFTFKTKAEALTMMDREISGFAQRLHAEYLMTQKNDSFENGAKNLEQLRKYAENKVKIIGDVGDDGIDRDIELNDRKQLDSLLDLYRDSRRKWERYLADAANYAQDKELERQSDGSSLLRGETKIEEYVSKHDAGHNRFYKYAAIKKAIIQTRFNNGIDANIRLIDTVGIGDPGVDTEERMMEAVNDEADGVIFILNVDSVRHEYLETKDRKLIKKFQDVYHIFGSREAGESAGEKKARYCMAFLANDRNMKEASDEKKEQSENREENYLDDFILPAFSEGTNQIFGENGIVYRQTINVAKSEQVEEMLEKFLEQISLHLHEIDAGMEAKARQAVTLAKAYDEELWRQLRSIDITYSDDSRQLNYVDELCADRIEILRELLKEYEVEMVRGRENKDQTESFLQQSLKKVQMLKNGETLEGFYFAPGRQANLRDMIAHYYGNVKDIESYDGFSGARLAVLQAMQNVIREIGARPLANQTAAEGEFKRRIAEKCLEALQLDCAKLEDGILNKLTAKDVHFFEKLSKKLTDGLTNTDDIRKVFQSLDQFKLDKSNGITKALFNHFAAECFRDLPYAAPRVWHVNGNAKEDLFLQELQDCLDEFMEKVDERTSKEIYEKDEEFEGSKERQMYIDGQMYLLVKASEIVNNEWNVEAAYDPVWNSQVSGENLLYIDGQKYNIMKADDGDDGDRVYIGGQRYKKTMRKEVYLIDEDDQMLNELRNFMSVMESTYQDAWKKIISWLLKREFLLEDTERQKRWVSVSATAENLKRLLRESEKNG